MSKVLHEKIEDLVTIRHGLVLLKEKYELAQSRTKDEFLINHYKLELPRVYNLIKETENSILNAR